MEHDPARKERIELLAPILKANDRLAELNRKRFAHHQVTVIDLIGSPGAGKTALLEATSPRLACELRCAAVMGDVATTRDAERIAATGVPAVQIATETFGGSCHLEAATVGQAIERLDLDGLDLLFIENVGNLICPAGFDLGQAARVLVFSVTEGEDKPLKYPLAFRTADLVVVSKLDLLPHLRVDLPALDHNLARIRPPGTWLKLSAQTSEGLDDWLQWLRARVNQTETR